MSAKGLLGSLLGAGGGRAIGQMLGGRTGAMIGSFAGSMLGGRGARSMGRSGGGFGSLLGGLMGGGDNNDDQGSANAHAEIDDSQAELLIRAMCNSAKADGSIDEAEMQKIVGELGDVDQDDRALLQRELESDFISPDDLARDIPGDWAPHAYAVSLMAITLDNEPEASYLRALAQSLGLSEGDVNEIHDEIGAPHLF